MTSNKVLLVGWDSLDAESYKYFLDELGEGEEVAIPENSVAERLSEIGNDVFKYEFEAGELYRTDTEHGDLFYGPEEALDGIFPDIDTWGTIYDSLDELEREVL